MDENMDIYLEETETVTMLFIPGVTVVPDSDDNAKVNTQNKEYQEFLQNKIGSDSYNERPAQTFNLTQKAKEVVPDRLSMIKNAEVQASTYEIDDESNMERDSEAVKMKKDYEKSINDIMNDKLKDPGALIDSEKLASHVSIATTTLEKTGNKSGTTSGKSSKIGASSKSALKESTTKSVTSDKMSATSTS